MFTSDSALGLGGRRYAARPVKSFRRAVLALGVTGLVAAVLRLRGTGGVPPQSGGWRELSGPDLR